MKLCTLCGFPYGTPRRRGVSYAYGHTFCDDCDEQDGEALYALLVWIRDGVKPREPVEVPER